MEISESIYVFQELRVPRESCKPSNAASALTGRGTTYRAATVKERYSLLSLLAPLAFGIVLEILLTLDARVFHLLVVRIRIAAEIESNLPRFREDLWILQGGFVAN